MCKSFIILFVPVLCVQLFSSESAKILVFIPTASFSHQVVLRPLTQELAKRGHKVTVITTDPAFDEDNVPRNLKEINLHDIAYKTMEQGFAEQVTGNTDDVYTQITSFAKIIQNTFEAEVTSEPVQGLIKNEKFDLLILEACVKPVLIFSHIFKAPVILFSSMPTYDAISEYTGSEIHPLQFPSYIHQKINNLTMWEKVKEVYKHYYFERTLAGEVTDMGDRMLKRVFGDNIPPLNELARNIDMVFLAEHHIWDSNRAVPPNMLYVGGIYPPNKDIYTHQIKEIPKDIRNYLDTSSNGVIYMSLGTNINTSLLPEETVRTFLKVFSQLPYNILLRWNDRRLQGEIITNVKIVHWVPQTAILRHLNMKLFINQAGLQSIEDAISAGVPIIGIPMLADQWFNVERAVNLKIGKRLDMGSITEKTMLEAVKEVIEDESYRKNIQRLRTLLHDQPQSALDRAVWWTEHVIRNKGAQHLKAPSALISRWKYYQRELMLLLVASVGILALVLIVSYKLL